MGQNIDMQHRVKFPKWLLLILLIPAIFLTIHFYLFSTIKDTFKAEKSVNPEATEYFIHASIIGSIYVSIIHKVFDYDSLAMKPLLKLTDYYFEKGEELVRADNGEDGVWWYLTYAYIYNIDTPKRIDVSMNIYSLSKKEEIELRDKIANYVINIGNNDVKGVEFGKYKSSAMHTMFATHSSHMDPNKLYDGETDKERLNNYWRDTTLHKKAIESYLAYKKFIKRDKYFRRYKYIEKNMLGRLRYLIYYDFTNHSLESTCRDWRFDFLKLLSNQIYLLNKYSSSEVQATQLVLDKILSNCDNNQTIIDEILILQKELIK